MKKGIKHTQKTYLELIEIIAGNGEMSFFKKNKKACEMFEIFI